MRSELPDLAAYILNMRKSDKPHRIPNQNQI
jgi:hypothetical protein